MFTLMTDRVLVVSRAVGSGGLGAARWLSTLMRRKSDTSAKWLQSCDRRFSQSHIVKEIDRWVGDAINADAPNPISRTSPAQGRPVWATGFSGKKHQFA